MFSQTQADQLRVTRNIRLDKTEVDDLVAANHITSDDDARDSTGRAKPRSVFRQTISRVLLDAMLWLASADSATVGLLQPRVSALDSYSTVDEHSSDSFGVKLLPDQWARIDATHARKFVSTVGTRNDFFRQVLAGRRYLFPQPKQY